MWWPSACLPPAGVSICVPGRDKLCSGLFGIPLGGYGNPITTHTSASLFYHLPLSSSLHLTSVTAQTWEWFNQRCWGGATEVAPMLSTRMPIQEMLENTSISSASLQTFLSSELPPSRPSQPSQGPGGRVFAWLASQRTFRSWNWIASLQLCSASLALSVVQLLLVIAQRGKSPLCSSVCSH